MNNKVRYTLIAVATLLSTAAGYFVANQGTSKQAVTASNTAPATAQLLALTLPNVAGTPQALNQWKGKLLVVNFWATWCAPCREEMPGFSRIQDKYAAKGVQFVGIAFDSVEAVKEFSLPAPISYPFLIATPETMRILAGLGNVAGGLPFTLLIGRDGVPRQSHLGVWRESALEDTIQKYLAE